MCVWHSRNKSESSRRRGCHSTWHNNIKTPLAGSSKKAGIKVARCLLPVEQKQQQEKEKERVSEREGAVGGARSCCTVAVLPGALPRRCHCGRAANYFASHTHTLATLISVCKCVACVCLCVCVLGRVMQLAAHVAVAVASSSPLSPCDNAIMLRR